MEFSLCTKIIVFDSQRIRTTKHNNTDNKNKIPKSSAIKKCLFGECDPLATEQMIKEQFELDRLRFLERFGFDVSDIENLENEQPGMEKKKCGKSSDKLISEKRKIVNKRKQQQREVFKPYNKQPVLTDYFKARKSTIGHSEKGKDSKENEVASSN